MSARLENLAKRVAADPFFLAAALDCFSVSEKCDDRALAARLGCPIEMLVQLRLCRMPRSEAPFFWQDIETIASRFRVNANALAEIVRHGQTLIHLRTSTDTAGNKGAMMAARDGAEKPDSQQGGRP